MLEAHGNEANRYGAAKAIDLIYRLASGNWVRLTLGALAQSLAQGEPLRG